MTESDARASGIGSTNGRLLALAHVAWFVCAALAIGILLASIPLGFAPRVQNIFPFPIDAPDWYVARFSYAKIGVSLLTALASIGVAALLYWKRRRDPMALFVSFFLIGYGVALAGPLEVLIGVSLDLPIVNWHSGLVVTLGAINVIQSAVFIVMAFLFYIFPDGRLYPGWTRYAVFLFLLVSPGLMFVFSFEWPAAMTPLGWMIGAVSVPLLSACVYVQIYRFRHVSTPVERQQSKLVVFGLILTFAILTLLQVPYFIVASIPAGVARPWWQPLSGLGWQISLAILPLSLAVAVMRFRLWDIDVIIRRTLIYSLLTGILGIVYFGGVVLLQQLFRVITGAGGELAIIITTLGVTVLANPLRGRIQNTIDRRFFRHKYDAQQVLAQFALTARDVTDLETLTAKLMETVDETLRPDGVSVWLMRRRAIK